MAERASFGDLVGRAASTVGSRLGRTIATGSGVALAVACALSVLLLTASAAQAITYEFDRVKATSVSATLPETGADLSPRIDQIRNRPRVVAAGIWQTSQRDVVLARTSASRTIQADVIAVDTQAQSALFIEAASGRLLDSGSPHDVALAGETLWASLGMANRAVPATGLSVQINGRPVVIVGVVRSLDPSVSIGTALVVRYQSSPVDWTAMAPPEVAVRTELGAAPGVAADLPLILYPEDVGRVSVSYTPTVGTTQDRVTQQTRTLSLVSAGVLALIGGLSIATAIGGSVRNRRAEIGLLRAIGALRREVAAQFVLEGAATGLVGGAIGTLLGFNAAAVIALSQQWALVVLPVPILVAPVVGAVIGTVAAIWPAWRAASSEPVDALRND